jgi:predicted TIM-barrel fold metal-dependent hydrolase
VTTAPATPTLLRAGFPVFDADNHFYETTDALTKYLPASCRDAVEFVDVEGRKKIAIRGEVSEYIPNPTFERIGRPGSQEQYFKEGNPDGLSPREIVGRGIDCPPAFRNAVDRLAHMDEQGLDYTLMMPTLVSLIEERMRDEPDVCHDVIHAFNQWMVEEWPFVHEGRIFAAPYITPALVGRAVEELEWVLERGAKAVLMRPAPAWGHDGPRSLGLAEFDPFWRLVQESGTLVVLHVSDSGYDRYYNEWEGQGREMVHFERLPPFKLSQLFNHRPIEDAITSLICHGTFWRFPDARVALVENGGTWVPNLLDHLDHVALKSPQSYEMTPSETFKRNVWVQANHEEDPRPLIDRIGIDRVLFGSDYPHTEGLADPLSYLADIADLPLDDQRKLMGGNMLDLMGINAVVASA